jgi:hypothetical protein
MWTDEIFLSVKFSNRYLILPVAQHISTNVEFVLACVYGDPHHRFITMIWDHISNFVNNNLGKPAVCLGDLNDILCEMDTTSINVNRNRMRTLNTFVKQCGLLI